MKAPNQERTSARSQRASGRSTLEIAVYAGRLEITERFGDDQADKLISRLRSLGLNCELVFKAPCG
jgi:hypothetical protein